MRRDNNCNPQGRQGRFKHKALVITGWSIVLIRPLALTGTSMPVLRHIIPKHRSAKVPKVPSPRGHEATKYEPRTNPAPIEARHTTEDTQLTGKTHPEEGELKSIYLTRIRLTKKKKKRMCEQHSQAPPTLASPKLETTGERGAPA
jgi:hypothetical protein